MKYSLKCPAKINEFLAVGKPDERNYHPIRTIFCTVSLFDTLEILEQSTDEIIVENAVLPEENSLTKALKYLKENCELNIPKIQIKLQKNIPIEAGLGGGSSDAAGVLRYGFNWAKNAEKIDENTLNSFITNSWVIGADVPFFVRGGRAIGEGYGEKLQQLEDFENCYLIIAKPRVGCATGDTYNLLDKKPMDFRPLPAVSGFLADPYNDFERVAPCESLELIELLQLRGAFASMLSGSGSAVFGAFRTEKLRDTAFLELRTHRNLSICRCEPLPQYSPYKVD